MAFRRTNPDEVFVLNGTPVTGWQLAEARQQLAHEGAHLDRWDELSDHDREMAALSAGNYLRALATLLPAEDPHHVIDLRADGWTIKHPVACRPNLFDCPVNRAAERNLTQRPRQAPGRYVCAVGDTGRFEIGAAHGGGTAVF